MTQTHADKKNNIALRVQSGVVFTVLNLQYYEWQWVKAWEIISVKEANGEKLYEVKKYETDGDKILVVVAPVWEGER